MTTRRLVALFGVFLAAYSVVMGRLFLLARNRAFADTAQAQTVTTLQLDSSRGNIYDCKGRNLTAYGVEYYALSIPGESSYARLFNYVPYAGQSLLYSRRNSHEPFLVPVEEDLSAQGIYTYAVPGRYFPVPVAPHLLGYVNGEGEGVSGLERAFDEVLGSQRTQQSVQCVTTAQGNLVTGSEPQLITRQGQSTGVMLTLDETIQRACEGVAQKNMTQGCVLVMEVDSARVRASVSLPEFDPNAVEKSIEAQDTSLLNRVLCQYNVGSVFKPVLAAAALEKTWDWYTYDCEGSVDLNGHVYRCALSRAHGQMNLTSALEKSCNCFFIELGLKLGGESVSRAAKDFGFGDAVYLAGGLQSAEGNLPDAQRLEDLGQLASVSFGQGELLATPVQVAGAFNAIAADGVWRTPSFLEAVIDETSGAAVQSLYAPESRRVVSEENAAALQEMLASVVEYGLGKDAQPLHGCAAGKTGTAQTGVFNEAGEELMNYWFAGFWPAEDPRYTIVVMQDGAPEPAVSCGDIFAQICESLYWLEPGRYEGLENAQTEGLTAEISVDNGL